MRIFQTPMNRLGIFRGLRGVSRRSNIYSQWACRSLSTKRTLLIPTRPLLFIRRSYATESDQPQQQRTPIGETYQQQDTAQPEVVSEEQSTEPLDSLLKEGYESTVRPDPEERRVEVYNEEGIDEESKAIYHEFDTQKIYSSLKYSGFADGQAETIMLTVKDMLSKRLAELKENSYPISAAENEAYLFEAACSEMRNEIQIGRQTQAEEYRSNQAALQRDVEILQQEMNEMVSSLKSEVEMEINERKNSTKAEETSIDLRIQELNNRITIDINSDIKSKIEALRWQTTRRGLLAVLIIAFGILMATSATKKDESKKPKRRDQQSTSPADEYQVPVLAVSEVDDSLAEDRTVVESINNRPDNL